MLYENHVPEPLDVMNEELRKEPWECMLAFSSVIAQGRHQKPSNESGVYLRTVRGLLWRSLHPGPLDVFVPIWGSACWKSAMKERVGVHS